jgi:uncharacterized membrane protein YgcG
MREAKPNRFLPPMTMADILQPQINPDPEERRKILKRVRGMRRRFIAFVILSFIYASSGISIAAVVVPAVVKQISRAVGGATASQGAGEDRGLASDETDASAVVSGGSTATGSSRSGSGGGGSYGGGGGGGAAPEPSSVILLTIGCAALCGGALRRKLARRL